MSVGKGFSLSSISLLLSLISIIQFLIVDGSELLKKENQDIKGHNHHYSTRDHHSRFNNFQGQNKEESKASQRHSNRLETIDQHLNSLYENLSSEFRQTLPREMSEIIRDYERNNSFDEIYASVMNGLSTSLNLYSKEDWNFYSETFIAKLHQMILLKKDGKFTSEFFWIDLTRLLLKWIIYIIQKDNDNNGDNVNGNSDNVNGNSDNVNGNSDNVNGNSDNNRNRLQKASNDIKSIISIILQKRGNLQAEPNLDLNFMERFKPFKSLDLMNCEFMENPHIFRSFGSAVNSFYNMNMSCDELKATYFNGNFSSNPLLRLLIIFHDPYKEMKKCFPGYENSKEEKEGKESSSNPVNSFIELTPGHIDEIKTKGPLGLYHFKDLSFITSSVVEFFQENNKRIRITDTQHLITLLRRLREMKLLSYDVISNIIGFEYFNNRFFSLNWSRRRFKKFLYIERMNGGITWIEYGTFLSISKFRKNQHL